MKKFLIILIFVFAGIHIYAQGPNGGRRTMGGTYEVPKKNNLQKNVSDPRRGIFKKRGTICSANKGKRVPVVILDNKKKKRLKIIQEPRNSVVKHSYKRVKRLKPLQSR